MEFGGPQYSSQPADGYCVPRSSWRWETFMSMNKAIRAAAKFLDRREVQMYRTWFCRIGAMPGADGLFARVVSGTDKETLLDHLAVATHALIFAGLGFKVCIEPAGKAGPDLAVSRDGHTAVVEVTRFRPMHPGPPMVDLTRVNPILLEYGNPSRDVRKAVGKIYEKFSQIGDGEAIIALWNDEGDLEKLEVEMAVDDLRQSPFPSGLLFAVYASRWWFPRAGQILCFPFPRSLGPRHVRWQQELEGSFVGEAIQRALENAV